MAPEALLHAPEVGCDAAMKSAREPGMREIRQLMKDDAWREQNVSPMPEHEAEGGPVTEVASLALSHMCDAPKLESWKPDSAATSAIMQKGRMSYPGTSGCWTGSAYSVASGLGSTFFRLLPTSCRPSSPRRLNSASSRIRIAIHNPAHRPRGRRPDCVLLPSAS
jgi:hypothetical protein